jgi:hypothetical protein
VSERFLGMCAAVLAFFGTRSKKRAFENAEQRFTDGINTSLVRAAVNRVIYLTSGSSHLQFLRTGRRNGATIIL